MKLKIGNWLVKVEPVLPEVGVVYHHKDRDPHDMISHVVPQWVEDGHVRYAKFYKDPSIKTAMETCPVAEFNKWFRKGA
jgi:hypothetical protein